MRFCIPLVCVLAFVPSTLPGQQIHVTMLPRGKLYEPYFADALSHQFSLSKHFESSQWRGNIGGVLPIVAFRHEHHIFHVSIGAMVFNTVVRTGGRTWVYSVDYLYDLILDARLSQRVSARILLGHFSGHFADDGIVEFKQDPINFVRDYVGLHGQYLLPRLNGKFYLGTFYSYNNDPVGDRQTIIQTGGDAGIRLLRNTLLYGAVDVKIKSEVNSGTTRSLQVGVLYLTSNGGTVLRFAFTHRRGFDERGQFFDQSDVKNDLGIYLEF